MAAISMTPTRRAIALDSETTGFDPNQNNIAEIAFKIIDMTTGIILDSYQSLVKLSEYEWSRANPSSLKCNGITWEELCQKGKSREEIAFEITQIFEKHQIKKGLDYFLCQNPTFDRPFFNQIVSPDEQEDRNWPYHWKDLSSMNDALEMKKIIKGKIAPYFIPSSKDAIAAYHGLPPEQKPHKAMNGVDHMLEIYRKIIGFPSPAHAGSI